MYTLTARIFAVVRAAAIGAQIATTAIKRQKKCEEKTQNRAKTADFEADRPPLLHYGNNGAQTFRLRQN
ncbi:hypothetical protein MPLA_320005 [Mesorhizobium sp. ORS 3359]|nr:hypothetical protein MPLA_320005 [Mesorhizobium sp. ORS 3359]